MRYRLQLLPKLVQRDSAFSTRVVTQIRLSTSRERFRHFLPD
jgi:hypothetical protein